MQESNRAQTRIIRGAVPSVSIVDLTYTKNWEINGTMYSVEEFASVLGEVASNYPIYDLDDCVNRGRVAAGEVLAATMIMAAVEEDEVALSATKEAGKQYGFKRLRLSLMERDAQRRAKALRSARTQSLGHDVLNQSI